MLIHHEIVTCKVDSTPTRFAMNDLLFTTEVAFIVVKENNSTSTVLNNKQINNTI